MSPQAKNLVDARTDLRWSKTVESLAERGEFNKLWQFAKTTPPIWTVKIVKFLERRNWIPSDEEQPEFFSTICKLTQSCNEFDLPGPEQRVPQVSSYGRRFTTSRISNDGEFLFVIDYHAANLEILRTDDLALVELIKLDYYRGRRVVCLAFAVAPWAENVAVLLIEPDQNKLIVRVFALDGGELLSSKELEWTRETNEFTASRMSFDSSGQYLVVQSEDFQLKVFDVSGRALKSITSFSNKTKLEESHPDLLQTWFQNTNLNLRDLRRLSLNQMAHVSSRNLAVSAGVKELVATFHCAPILWKSDSLVFRMDGELIFQNLDMEPCREDLVHLESITATASQAFENRENDPISYYRSRESARRLIAKLALKWKNTWQELCKPLLDLTQLSAFEIADSIRFEEKEGAAEKILQTKIRNLYVNHFVMSSDAKHVCATSFYEALAGIMMWKKESNTSHTLSITVSPFSRLAISEDGELLAAASPSQHTGVQIFHLPDGRSLGCLYGLSPSPVDDICISSGGSILAFTRDGTLHKWEADGNGNAFEWSNELVAITHQPVDESSLNVMKQANEMRRRGWLSVQESNLLDLAIHLMENRLSLDIEIDWSETVLPGDELNIEIEETHDESRYD